MEQQQDGGGAKPTWAVSEYRENNGSWILTLDGIGTATVRYMGAAKRGQYKALDPAGQALAAAICRDLNAHDDLLAALWIAVDQMRASAKADAQRRGHEYVEERHDPIVAALAAIAKASA